MKLLVVRLLPPIRELTEIPPRREILLGKEVDWGERWENVVEFDDNEETRNYFTSHPFAYRIVNLPEGYIRINGLDHSVGDVTILDRPDNVLLKKKGGRKEKKSKKRIPKSK